MALPLYARIELLIEPNRYDRYMLRDGICKPMWQRHCRAGFVVLRWQRHCRAGFIALLLRLCRMHAFARCAVVTYKHVREGQRVNFQLG